MRILAAATYVGLVIGAAAAVAEARQHGTPVPKQIVSGVSRTFVLSSACVVVVTSNCSAPPDVDYSRFPGWRELAREYAR